MNKDLIGIVVPLPQEARAFGLKARTGEFVPSKDLLVAISGIGKEAALLAAERLRSLGITRLLTFGTAAALAPHLDSGQLLLPGSFHLLSGDTFPAHSTFWRELTARLEPLQPETGPLLAVEEVIATPWQKRRLYDATEASALDLESGFLAQWAKERSLPFAAVRVVVDRADMGLPQSLVRALDAQGHLRFRTFLRECSPRPFDLAALVRLALAFQKARKTLTQAARRLCG